MSNPNKKQARPALKTLLKAHLAVTKQLLERDGLDPMLKSAIDTGHAEFMSAIEEMKRIKAGVNNVVEKADNQEKAKQKDITEQPVKTIANPTATTQDTKPKPPLKPLLKTHLAIIKQLLIREKLDPILKKAIEKGRAEFMNAIEEIKKTRAGVANSVNKVVNETAEQTDDKSKKEQIAQVEEEPQAPVDKIDDKTNEIIENLTLGDAIELIKQILDEHLPENLANFIKSKCLPAQSNPSGTTLPTLSKKTKNSTLEVFYKKIENLEINNAQSMINFLKFVVFRQEELEKNSAQAYTPLSPEELEKKTQEKFAMLQEGKLEEKEVPENYSTAFFGKKIAEEEERIRKKEKIDTKEREVTYRPLDNSGRQDEWSFYRRNKSTSGDWVFSANVPCIKDPSKRIVMTTLGDLPGVSGGDTMEIRHGHDVAVDICEEIMSGKDLTSDVEESVKDRDIVQDKGLYFLISMLKKEQNLLPFDPNSFLKNMDTVKEESEIIKELAKIVFGNQFYNQFQDFYKSAKLYYHRITKSIEEDEQKTTFSPIFVFPPISGVNPHTQLAKKEKHQMAFMSCNSQPAPCLLTDNDDDTQNNMNYLNLRSDEQDHRKMPPPVPNPYHFKNSIIRLVKPGDIMLSYTDGFCTLRSYPPEGVLEHLKTIVGHPGQENEDYSSKEIVEKLIEKLRPFDDDAGLAVCKISTSPKTPETHDRTLGYIEKEILNTLITKVAFLKNKPQEAMDTIRKIIATEHLLDYLEQ